MLLCLSVTGCGGTAATDADPPAPTQVSPAEARPAHDYRGWASYLPPGAGFAVYFPAEPAVTPASPASGGMEAARVARRAADTVGLSCQWRLKDAAARSRAADEAYLRGHQVGAVARSGGKLLGEQELDWDGFPGREYVIEVPERGVFRCRAVVSGRLTVTLLAEGRDGEAVQAVDVTQVLDSLRISR